MFAQLYNTNTRFGSEILEIFWKVFFITYMAMIALGMSRDTISDGIGTAIVIGIFKCNFILVGRVIYEILHKHVTDNDETNEKLNELIKATWKVHGAIKKLEI